MPRQQQRQAKISRKTKETDVQVEIAVDGGGNASVDTGVPFLDHMLDSFARHGFFDLKVKARGDLEVDQHHTVEDVGLTLGEALRTALGDKRGIRRFGEAACPLDEALVRVTVRVGDFDTELVHDFMLALTNQVGMNLHMDMVRGRNAHHVIEAGFKALARAMDAATQVDPRVTGVLSTKGTI